MLRLRDAAGFMVAAVSTFAYETITGYGDRNVSAETRIDQRERSATRTPFDLGSWRRVSNLQLPNLCNSHPPLRRSCFARCDLGLRR